MASPSPTPAQRFAAGPALRVVPGNSGQSNGMVWQTDACRQGQCHVYFGQTAEKVTTRPLVCGGGGFAGNDTRPHGNDRPEDHPAACFVTDPADIRAVTAACFTATAGDPSSSSPCFLWDGVSARTPQADPTFFDWDHPHWLGSVPRFTDAERGAWRCAPTATIGAVPNTDQCWLGGAAVDVYRRGTGTGTALVYGPLADCPSLTRAGYRALGPRESGLEPAFVSVLDAAKCTAAGPCSGAPLPGGATTALACTTG